MFMIEPTFSLLSYEAFLPIVNKIFRSILNQQVKASLFSIFIFFSQVIHVSQDQPEVQSYHEGK